MAAGAQMWQSEMFTEDQMVTWENRTSATQTWTELQTYFTEKWLEQKQETTKADCRVVQIVEHQTVPRPVEQAPATRSHSRSLRVDMQSSAA